MFDVEKTRRDFPILQRKVHGKPLIWLDSAATGQKPQVVIDRVSRFYEHENSNIHRGTHTLAETTVPHRLPNHWAPTDRRTWGGMTVTLLERRPRYDS